MEAIQVIAPLLGVILGSVLAGIGASWRIRQERKRIIAVALADLLEVRHRLVGFNALLEKVRHMPGVTPAVMPNIRHIFDTMVPPDPGLGERYSRAVSLLAGIDPMLAFSLRSKDSLPKLITGMRAKAIAEGADLEMYESFESQLLKTAKPALDKAVLELARSHSPFTARRVKRHIAKSSALPEDAAQFLDQMSAMNSPAGNRARAA